jgi:hypothetical protein
VGTLSLFVGIICMVISLLIYVPDLKKASSVKERWMAVLDFIIDPFTGLTALFYFGVLLMLYGLCVLTGVF